MKISSQLAKHIRELFFGGNWTDVNLKDTLNGITWQQAVTKIYDLNTIAMLVFHINYYISAVLKVLHGEPLKASDKFAFDLPPIHSEQDWQQLVDKAFSEAKQFATKVEELDDRILPEIFTDEKYGNYYRNISGLIEHSYYHMGQIMLIKKILNGLKM